ncbi:ATP-binding cassette domain-containing protein [Propionibacteriaceae bacterium G1746]|uniref:ATP-binding cassette domain-containing protein n=1 Tax=Aestuariimicrobium sp. G57 TaxID=3418485 RepID=UPI003C1349A4
MTVTVGRDPSSMLVLDDPLVSRQHAMIRREGPNFGVRDANSRNGTQLNGHDIRQALVTPGDRLTIGRTSFANHQGVLVELDDRDTALVANNISFTLKDGKVLMDGLSFSVPGGSLVAIVGPSGAGKSTLLKALTGSQPATSGQVFYAGHDLYQNYEQLRTRIGVVPQDDVVHRDLTVRKSLGYAAELRLPADYDKPARDREVNEVIGELGLTAHADTLVKKLSGGQRKRTSVAMELITQPTLLLLDEPTSGLDPSLDRDVMELLRQQATGDRTVLVITHSVANLDDCDAVVVLAPGGKLAYFGPPSQVAQRFGTDNYADIFDYIKADPNRWQAIERHAQAAAGHPAQQLQRQGPPPQLPRPRPPKTDRQFSTLVRRQLEIIISDRSYAALSLLMPIVLGFAAWVIPGEQGFGSGQPSSEPGQLLLVLVMCGALMGMVTTVRELIAERPIYLRERAVGVQPLIYLWSKVSVLAGLSLVQALLLVIVVLIGKDGPSEGALFPGSFELVWMVFLMTLATGMLGLLFSGLVTSQEQTMPVLAVSVILQLLLCGGLIDITGRQPLDLISHLVPGRWAFGMGANTIDYRSLNPSAPDDWLWEHNAGVWFISGMALLVFSAAMFWGTLKLLERRKSST